MIALTGHQCLLEQRPGKAVERDCCTLDVDSSDAGTFACLWLYRSIELKGPALTDGLAPNPAGTEEKLCHIP